MIRSHGKKALYGGIAAATLLITGCSSGNGGDAGTESMDFVWGSASTGSDSFTMMEAMTSTVNNHTSASHSTISTAGSVENATLLNEGELQFGSSTSDTLYAAANGEDPYEEPIEVSQVMSFVYWTVPLVTPIDSGIESLDDLRGESVAVGNVGQSSAQMFEAIFKEADILDEVDVQYLDGQDSTDALKSNQISAATVSQILGEGLTPAFEELAQTMEFEPISIDQGVLDSVVESNPSLLVETTSADTLGSYTEDSPSIATTGILVVDPDVDEEIVYEVTSAILENLEDVQSVAPTRLGALTPQFACEQLVGYQPIHPGAERYYEENDLCQ